MIAVKEKPQLNLFGDEARKRVHTRLCGWYGLTRRIAHLTDKIEREKESLRRLTDKIEAIVPRYDTMDMPRGTDVSDRTGNLAAAIVDRKEELKLSILYHETELEEARRQLREIETAVAELNPRDAEIVRRYYLERERYQSICNKMRVHKSRFYQILEAVLDVLGDLL